MELVFSLGLSVPFSKFISLPCDLDCNGGSEATFPSFFSGLGSFPNFPIGHI
jgi:hypothetical protein